MMKTMTLMALVAISLAPQAYPFSAWDEKNRPELFEFDYERTLNELPKQGTLSKRPWSGNYWATHMGGITFRWNKEHKVEDEMRYGYELIDFNNLDNNE
ncbi:MAG: hypothetical protein ACO2ZP_10625, partial [Bacteriovoracaceae bacterium]